MSAENKSQNLKPSFSQFIKPVKRKEKTSKKRYSYKGFYRRLQEINLRYDSNVQSISNILGSNNFEDLAESNYCSLIKNLLASENSKELYDLLKKLENNSENLAIVLLKKTEIIQDLMSFISKYKTKECETIYDILISLIKDIRSEMLKEFIESILPKIIPLMVDQSSLSLLEMQFRFITFSLKFVSDALSNENIKTIIQVCKSLISNKFFVIRQFIAECFCYIIRAKSFDYLYLTTLLQPYINEENNLNGNIEIWLANFWANLNYSENWNLIEGISRIYSEVIRGTRGAIHSKGKKIFYLILKNLLSPLQQDHIWLIRFVNIHLISKILIENWNDILFIFTQILSESEEKGQSLYFDALQVILLCLKDWFILHHYKIGDANSLFKSNFEKMLDISLEKIKNAPLRLKFTYIELASICILEDFSENLNSIFKKYFFIIEDNIHFILNICKNFVFGWKPDYNYLKILHSKKYNEYNNQLLLHKNSYKSQEILFKLLCHSCIDYIEKTFCKKSTFDNKNFEELDSLAVYIQLLEKGKEKLIQNIQNVDKVKPFIDYCNQLLFNNTSDSSLLCPIGLASILRLFQNSFSLNEIEIFKDITQIKFLIQKNPICAEIIFAILSRNLTNYEPDFKVIIDFIYDILLIYSENHHIIIACNKIFKEILAKAAKQGDKILCLKNNKFSTPECLKSCEKLLVKNLSSYDYDLRFCSLEIFLFLEKAILNTINKDKSIFELMSHVFDEIPTLEKDIAIHKILIDLECLYNFSANGEFFIETIIHFLLGILWIKFIPLHRPAIDFLSRILTKNKQFIIILMNFFSNINLIIQEEVPIEYSIPIDASLCHKFCFKSASELYKLKECSQPSTVIKSINKIYCNIENHMEKENIINYLTYFKTFLTYFNFNSLQSPSCFKSKNNIFSEALKEEFLNSNSKLDEELLIKKKVGKECILSFIEVFGHLKISSIDKDFIIENILNFVLFFKEENAKILCIKALKKHDALNEDNFDICLNLINEKKRKSALR